MSTGRWLLLAIIVALFVAFFALGLHEHLTLESLKSARAQIDAYRGVHPVASSAIFMAAYIVMAALSLPGAGILTLASGAIFGLAWGLVLVSFASSIGATLAMLVARFILHDAIQSRYGKSLKAVNDGVRRDGIFYLFTLRLIPVFPFFIVNLAMGLTPIPARTFYWVSQIGMLPITAVFVNAGVELARIDTLSDILSPRLLGALVLIGLFPLLAKKVLAVVRARRTGGRKAE